MEILNDIVKVFKGLALAFSEFSTVFYIITIFIVLTWGVYKLVMIFMDRRDDVFLINELAGYQKMAVEKDLVPSERYSEYAELLKSEPSYFILLYIRYLLCHADFSNIMPLFTIKEYRRTTGQNNIHLFNIYVVILVAFSVLVGWADATSFGALTFNALVFPLILVGTLVLISVILVLYRKSAAKYKSDFIASVQEHTATFFSDSMNPYYEDFAKLIIGKVWVNKIHMARIKRMIKAEGLTLRNDLLGKMPKTKAEAQEREEEEKAQKQARPKKEKFRKREESEWVPDESERPEKEGFKADDPSVKSGHEAYLASQAAAAAGNQTEMQTTPMPTFDTTVVSNPSYAGSAPDSTAPILPETVAESEERPVYIDVKPVHDTAARLVVTPEGVQILTSDGKPIITPDGKFTLGSGEKIVLTSDGKLVLTSDGKRVFSVDGKQLFKPDGKPFLTRHGKFAITPDGRMALTLGGDPLVITDEKTIVAASDIPVISEEKTEGNAEPVSSQTGDTTAASQEVKKEIYDTSARTYYDPNVTPVNVSDNKFVYDPNTKTAYNPVSVTGNNNMEKTGGDRHDLSEDEDVSETNDDEVLAQRKKKVGGGDDDVDDDNDTGELKEKRLGEELEFDEFDEEKGSAWEGKPKRRGGRISDLSEDADDTSSIKVARGTTRIIKDSDARPEYELDSDLAIEHEKDDLRIEVTTEQPRFSNTDRPLPKQVYGSGYTPRPQGGSRSTVSRNNIHKFNPDNETDYSNSEFDVINETEQSPPLTIEAAVANATRQHGGDVYKAVGSIIDILPQSTQPRQSDQPTRRDGLSSFASDLERRGITGEEFIALIIARLKKELQEGELHDILLRGQVPNQGMPMQSMPGQAMPRYASTLQPPLMSQVSNQPPPPPQHQIQQAVYSYNPAPYTAVVYPTGYQGEYPAQQRQPSARRKSTSGRSKTASKSTTPRNTMRRSTTTTRRTSSGSRSNNTGSRKASGDDEEIGATENKKRSSSEFTVLDFDE